MPYYVVQSDGPIKVREIEGGEVGGGPILPERPSWPERPGGGPLPSLPPRDEWPELPPWLKPGVGLPIPPSPEFPWVPVDPPVDPPAIWPPMPGNPELPDLSNKTLILACFFVSRYVKVFRWVVIDHDEAKSKLQKAIDWVKAHMPAGGIGGTPPPRPGPQ